MKAFKTHTGIAAPMIVDNIDTDQIIPSREMKRVSKLGLGDGLFAGWRYQYDDMRKIGLIDDFVLNLPQYEGASVLLGGKNWGCGSSREHAVWALYDFGIRVIVAPSFGRIFHRNCARNGLLAIELPQENIERIAKAVLSDPQSMPLRIDLELGIIEIPGGRVFEFTVPESDRIMLTNGLDYIEYTMRYADSISNYVQSDRKTRPWAYL